ncbi:chemotaxis protein CheW [Ekhidna sp.]|uniref:chemotaxis protein CheW n=1 Tax=Ekhidna sp. TaxID=2608089 RepID=UPI003296C6AE
MALGKNLKKRKLIAEKQAAPKKTTSKKKNVVKADKELIEKPKAKKPTKASKQKVQPKPLKKVTTKKKKTVQNIPKEKPAVQDTGLPIYIARELHDLKTTLRNRYKEEVAKLKGAIVQLVIIEIGGERYAVDIDCVKEVVPASNLSKTPNTPSHIQGIANVRGATYVVFDLSKKFKLEEEVTHNYLLVLEHESISAAISLNLLPTTRKINGDHISSELHIIENASLDVSYIKGLIRDEEQLIYYLDIIELLKNDKAIVVPDNLIDSKK